jgi:hypothetical protein
MTNDPKAPLKRIVLVKPTPKAVVMTNVVRKTLAVKEVKDAELSL